MRHIRCNDKISNEIKTQDERDATRYKRCNEMNRCNKMKKCNQIERNATKMKQDERNATEQKCKMKDITK